MTTIEHMMLTSVFITADLIHTAIRKCKDKREKKRHEALMSKNKKTTE